MKLASLKGGRDGRLVVVSRDLTKAADAAAVAPTLRDALDDWAAAEPRLQEIANSLVQCGIMGILNFSPIVLHVPEDVMVNSVNLAIELENLSYFIQE